MASPFPQGAPPVFPNLFRQTHGHHQPLWKEPQDLSPPLTKSVNGSFLNLLSAPQGQIPVQQRNLTT